MAVDSLQDLPVDQQLAINRLCRLFERRWSNDKPTPAFEAFFNDELPSDARRELVRELVAVQHELSVDRGVAFDVSAQCEALPEYAEVIRGAADQCLSARVLDSERDNGPVLHAERNDGPDLRADANDGDAVTAASARHSQPRGVGLRPELPKQIGEFRIIREIGRGGMGIVYEAEQTSVGRIVALKTLAPELMSKPGALDRFRREVMAIGRLDHRHIVPIFSSGVDDNVAWFCMRRLNGPSAADVVSLTRAFADKRRKPAELTETDVALPRAMRRCFPSAEDSSVATPSVSEDSEHLANASETELGLRLNDANSESDAVESDTLDYDPWYQNIFSISDDSNSNRERVIRSVGQQVADAIAHAHSNGILHRDIKPSNILLDVNIDAYVVDFGLAKIVHDNDDLSSTGDLLGSLRYLPPEALRGQRDERGDVYSLGLVLYELLTLTAPFEVSDRFELLGKLQNSRPPRPSELWPGISPELEDVVLRATDPDPDARIQSAAELSRELAALPRQRFPFETRDPDGRIVRRVSSALEDVAIRSTDPDPVARMRIIRRVLASVAAVILVGLVISETLFLKSLPHPIEPNQRASQSPTKQAASPTSEITKRQGDIGAKPIAEHSRDFRGLLPAAIELSDGRLAQLETRMPRSAVRVLVLSRDGERLYCGTQLGHVREYDITGKLPALIRILQGLRSSITSIDVSSSGKVLAGSVQGQAILWDEAGQPAVIVPMVGGNRNPVLSVAWQPDEQRLAIGRFSGVEFFQSDGSPDNTAEPIVASQVVAWSPDGEWIASGRVDVRLQHRSSGFEISLPAFKYAISQLKWSPNSKWLLTYGDSHEIRLVKVPPRLANKPKSQPPTVVWKHTSMDVHSATWRGDADAIILASDGNLRMRPTDAEPEIETFTAQVGGTSLVWHPRREQFVSGDDVGSLWFSSPDFQTTDRIAGEAIAVNGAVWSHDRERLLVGTGDATFAFTAGDLWKVDAAGDAQQVAEIIGCRQIAKHPNRDFVAVLDHAGVSLRSSLGELLEPSAEIPLTKFDLPALVLAWSPDGRWLAVSDGNAIHIVTVIGNAQTRRIEANALAMSWSPEGKRLAFVNATQFPYVVDWQASLTPKPFDLTPTTWNYSRIEWHPTHRRFVTGDSVGGVRLWSEQSGTRLLTTMSSTIKVIAWNQAGDRLAIADGTGQVAIRSFDAENDTSARMIRFQAHLDTVTCMSWCDETRLLTSGAGTVCVWELSDGKLQCSRSTFLTSSRDVYNLSTVTPPQAVGLQGTVPHGNLVWVISTRQ